MKSNKIQGIQEIKGIWEQAAKKHRAPIIYAIYVFMQFYRVFLNFLKFFHQPELCQALS